MAESFEFFKGTFGENIFFKDGNVFNNFEIILKEMIFVIFY